MEIINEVGGVVVVSKQNFFHGRWLLREEMIPALAVRLNGFLLFSRFSVNY